MFYAFKQLIVSFNLCGMFFERFYTIEALKKHPTQMQESAGTISNGSTSGDAL